MFVYIVCGLCSSWFRLNSMMASSAKKQKRLCSFKHEFTKTWPCIVKASTSDHARCIVCNVNFCDLPKFAENTPMDLQWKSLLKIKMSARLYFCQTYLKLWSEYYQFLTAMPLVRGPSVSCEKIVQTSEQACRLKSYKVF